MLPPLLLDRKSPLGNFHFNPEVGRLLVASSNPHSCDPSTPGNCHLSKAFCYQSPRSVEIAFLHFLEGCGDEFKPGTSATYSWSSVLLLFCAFLHQNENRMIRVSKLHSVDAMCPTRSLPSFPKCFREGLSLSSGWMKEDASASKHETA